MVGRNKPFELALATAERRATSLQTHGVGKPAEHKRDAADKRARWCQGKSDVVPAIGYEASPESAVLETRTCLEAALDKRSNKIVVVVNFMVVRSAVKVEVKDGT